MWSSEPGRVARRTVGGPARFPVMALREDRSGGLIGCARGFPHDCAVMTAARSGAERNDRVRLLVWWQFPRALGVEGSAGP